MKARIRTSRLTTRKAISWLLTACRGVARVVVPTVTFAALSLAPRLVSAKDHANEVPFKLLRGYAIVARGSIGNLKNLNFLIDTGAVPSVLDRRTADALHLTGTKEHLSVFTQKLAAELVIANNVQLGPVRTGSLSVVVRDLSFAESALGIRIDAMIGFDLLSQGPFVIDYQSKRLVFGPIDTSLPVIPYHSGPGYVAVELRVQQKTLLLLVDTGASDLVLFGETMLDSADAVTNIGSRTWSNMGGDIKVKQVQLRDAYLGAIAWGAQDVFILEVDDRSKPSGLSGLLGVISLKVRRVGFDPDRKVLVLDKQIMRQEPPRANPETASKERLP
jgi:predicted aspartyl protease